MQSRQKDARSLREEKLVSKGSSKVQYSLQEEQNHPPTKRTSLGAGKVVEHIQQIDGYKIAKIWKWARQDTNKSLKFKLALERVTAKGVYTKHQEVFDKLAKVFNENNVSPLEYVKFFAVE